MATKKANKKEETEAKDNKKAKKQLTPEERKAKAEARKERLRNLPEGQRTNSKQVDVIELDNGKVVTYANVVRKFGVVLQNIALDKNGNVVSTSITTLPGFRVKVKKGHGILVPGTPGVGKKGRGNDDDIPESVEEEEEEED